MKADEGLRDELLQRLVDTRLVGPYLQVAFNHRPERLPLRELPHGSWSELFLVYNSFCKVKGEMPASRSTFFAVATEWRQCLRFHKKTQHAQCLTCARLRAALHRAKAPGLYRAASSFV